MSSEQNQDQTPHDEFDDLDDDFSLDKLSRAYADVVRQRESDDEDEGKSGDAAAASAPQEPVPAPPQKDNDSQEDDFDHANAEAAHALQDDNAGCSLEANSIIESILFVGAPKSSPLTLSSISAVLRDVTATDVLEAIQELNEGYREQNAAYQIVTSETPEAEKDADGFDANAEVKLALADNLKEFSADYFGRNKQAQLSQATIDVLAVVAYNQPLSKADVENTRGKPSGTALAQLVRRDLLSIRTTETKPVTRLYETTQRFLELFQLEGVEDLPQSHDVSEFEEYID